MYIRVFVYACAWVLSHVYVCEVSRKLLMYIAFPNVYIRVFCICLCMVRMHVHVCEVSRKLLMYKSFLICMYVCLCVLERGAYACICM
jgi:hypothetical protein